MIANITRLVIVLCHVSTCIDDRWLVSRHRLHRRIRLSLHKCLGDGSLNRDSLRLHDGLGNGPLHGILLRLIGGLRHRLLYKKILNGNLCLSHRFLYGRILGLVLRLSDLLVSGDRLLDLRRLRHVRCLVDVIDFRNRLLDCVGLIDGRRLDDGFAHRRLLSFQPCFSNRPITDNLAFHHHFFELDLVASHRDLLINRFGLQSISGDGFRGPARSTILGKARIRKWIVSRAEGTQTSGLDDGSYSEAVLGSETHRGLLSVKL